MRTLALALLLAVLGAVPSRAGYPPEPVCGRPGVLRQLTFELRRAGRPLYLEASPIGQVSDGKVIHCAVRAHAVAYDTNHYGSLALDQVAVVQYALELRRNGIFLRVE